MPVDHRAAARVRGLFEHADYTVAGVRHLLGPVAGGALARDEIVPALRATRGGSPLEALTRLFWLQVPVPAAALPVDDLAALGLVERSGDEIRALLHVEPVESPPVVRAEPSAPVRVIGTEAAGPSIGGPPAVAGPPGATPTGGPPAGASTTGAAGGSGGGPFAGTAFAAPPSALGHVVSDLKARPGGRPPRPDHVVGQGGASASLAQLVIHSPVDNALDLGTGSGVQALHLAARARRITATDVSPRALDLARLSLALSAVDAELLEGSLFEPVAGRTFDLIVSNPPFVISPDARFEYRESGLPGDELCRRLVRQAPARLAPGGWCHLLANWLHVEGEDWRDRVAGWIEGADGWVVQRDVQDPAEYAELWLRDSCEAGSPEYRGRYDAWMEAFAAHKVTGIGFGWITLHNAGAGVPAGERRHIAGRSAGAAEERREAVDRPVGAENAGAEEPASVAGRSAGGADIPTGEPEGVVGPPADGGNVRVEELRHAVDQPVGAYVAEVVRPHAPALTPQTMLRTAAGLVQEQIGPPGAEDPERIVLRQTRGLRRAAQVGTVEAALAGACDGDLPLGPLLAAIAELTETDLGAVRARAFAVLPDLIADGFFDII